MSSPVRSRRGVLSVLCTVFATGCVGPFAEGDRGMQFRVFPVERGPASLRDGVPDDAEVLDCDDGRLREQEVFSELLDRAVEADDDEMQDETMSTREEPFGEIPVNEESGFAFVECEGRVYGLEVLHLE